MTDIKKTLYIIVEYVGGGGVFHYLVAHGSMKEKKSQGEFCYEVPLVQYYYQRCMVFRDLWAEHLHS